MESGATPLLRLPTASRGAGTGRHRMWPFSTWSTCRPLLVEKSTVSMLHGAFQTTHAAPAPAKDFAKPPGTTSAQHPAYTNPMHESGLVAGWLACAVRPACAPSCLPTPPTGAWNNYRAACPLAATAQLTAATAHALVVLPWHTVVRPLSPPSHPSASPNTPAALHQEAHNTAPVHPHRPKLRMCPCLLPTARPPDGLGPTLLLLCAEQPAIAASYTNTTSITTCTHPELNAR